MRRWLSRLMLFAILFAGCAGQDPDFTNGTPNGLFWQGMSRGEKLMFVLGVKYGVFAVSTSFMTGTLPTCPTPVDDDKWYAVTNSEVVRDVDAFYGTAKNIPLPIMAAVVHSLMKLNGASKLQLKQYRTLTLSTLAN